MDIHLHYQEFGQGKPLILLHGNGEDGSYFSNQIDYFSKKYRVIAVDTRGHGESPRGTAPFTIRQFVEDLHLFMKEDINVEKADILGFSDGGNIALLFAIKYPEMVDRLIIDGANLNTWGVRPKIQLQITWSYYKALWRAKKDSSAVRDVEMLGLMVNDPNIDVEELHKITSPTLVLGGNKDMIKKRHLLHIGRNIPNAQTQIIKGDHFIAAMHPLEFNAIVEHFLEETTHPMSDR